MNQTDEERELGLEPSKYTKQSWNPSDYKSSDAQNAMTIAMAKAIDDMRNRSAIKADQERLLGSSGEESMSDEEKQEVKKQMMKRMMGL